ncbi:fumarylacetoacetate hydrolase family protein [Microbacterium rhizosphaerae]|uniref:Fumarylacetoacetate hydrolase family protein n=1 Tax=Microbacterium rhizosphaerae TaxID=1678237 RepID=A0ABZ0SIZ3_9MICO|nr:fumarylacetoacetate hydrolase family protein [Microbacterium rhizosphaerae]WPR89339.1 fumarylacetoacetate hydrolase family protein [Microbacterium rhizosphaerae]
MRFARIGAPGREIPVVLVGDQLLDLRPLTPDIDGAFLAADPVGAVERAIGTLPVVEPEDGTRFGAPIARPGAVYCIGMNYAAHAREGGSEPPTDIVVFLKPPHTVVGSDDTIPLPPGTQKVDWEAELAIVIGTPAWQLTGPDAALDHIAGYTVANDLSERQWQLEISGGQWSKGKGAPGFCPLGPWLVTDADPSDLSIQSFVNGDVRQDSRTSDMIFDVATIVARLSAHTLLEPGDVILTGTPEGVALSGRFPYLTDDDVVEIAIEGLGRQRQRVAAAV